VQIVVVISVYVIIHKSTRSYPVTVEVADAVPKFKTVPPD
jgi:hypothetical protein